MDVSRPESQSAKSWQVAHGEGLPADVQEYVGRDDTPSLETIIELHQIREENADLRRNVWERVDDEDKRKILASTYFSNGRGVRYESLVDRLRCSERTIYRKLRDLEDAGVVERVGKPAVVVFADPDARLLVGDVLDTVLG